MRRQPLGSMINQRGFSLCSGFEGSETLCEGYRTQTARILLAIGRSGFHFREDELTASFFEAFASAVRERPAVSDRFSEL
jgi:hypothetical protein